MTKEKFLLSKKVALLFFITSLFIYNSSYSQCANPTPIGNTSQSFCAATDSRVNNLDATGGDVVWFDAPTDGNQYIGTAPLENGVTYYADDIVSNAGGSCSTLRLAVTVTINGDFPMDLDLFVGKCASSNPTVADLSATGTNIEWYDDQFAGNLLASTEPLTDGTIYWVQQTESGCTSLRFPTAVTVINPEPPTVDEFQYYCESTNPTVGDLPGSGTIVWFADELTPTPLDPATPLVNNSEYWAAQTDGIYPSCLSTIRVKSTAIIDLIPNAGTGSALTECEKDAITTDLFTLLGAADTTGTWSGPSALTGGHLGTFDPTVNLNGTYTYTVDSAEGICPSDSADVVVTITVVPPPTTTESTQIFCEIDAAIVSDLSIVETGTIDWFAFESDTTPIPPATPLANGVYWGALIDATTSCESASRLQVTVIIDPTPNAGTDGAYSTCEIDLVTTDLFTLLVGTPEITGTWSGPSDLSGGHLGTYDPAINIAGDYTYTVTSVEGVCLDATAIVSVVITTPPPPTTTETTQIFCEIDTATIDDLSIVEPSTILWYANDTDTTPIAAGTPLADGIYWGAQIEAGSACESASRLQVTVIIDTVPDAGLDGNYTTCEIDLITTNLYSLLGGTPEVTGTWSGPSDLSGDYLGTYDPAVNIAGVYTYTVSSTEGICADATAEVAVVITVIPPPTTTETSQSFCELDMPTIDNLSVNEIEPIAWYANDTDTTPIPAGTPLADGIYWGTQTDSGSLCESASRLQVTVTILTPQPPTISVITSTFCETSNATVADLSSDPTITWYADDVSTTPLLTSEALVDATDYWASQKDPSGCESVSRLQVTASIVPLPLPPTATLNQSFCLINGDTLSEIQITGTNILWYDDSLATTALSDSTQLVDGEDYWATQSPDGLSGCESATRTQVIITLLDTPPPVVTEPTQTFCASDNPTVAEISVTANTAIWYDSSGNGLSSDDPLENGLYSVADIDSGTGCESSVRASVTIVLTDPGTPTLSSSGNEFCKLDVPYPTLTDLNNEVTSANGGTITWYDSYPGGNLLSLSESLVEGASYFAVETDVDGCTSTAPLQVSVTLESCDEYDITVYDGFSPTGDGINDEFTINYLRDLYPDFRVEFYNRWGAKVYTSNASKPDWNGQLDGSGELAPAGVYFVIVYFNKDNRKPIQKRLYLSR